MADDGAGDGRREREAPATRRRTACQTRPTAGVIFVSRTGVHHAAERWMASTAASAMKVLMLPRRTSSFRPGTIRNQPARSQTSAATCAAVQMPRNSLERQRLDRRDRPQERRRVAVLEVRLPRVRRGVDSPVAERVAWNRAGVRAGAVSDDPVDDQKAPHRPDGGDRPVEGGAERSVALQHAPERWWPAASAVPYRAPIGRQRDERCWRSVRYLRRGRGDGRAPLDSPSMSGPAARRSFPLPGPVAIHAVVLGILLYAAFLSKGPWDSDYCWHVVTGSLIATRRVSRGPIRSPSPGAGCRGRCTSGSASCCSSGSWTASATWAPCSCIAFVPGIAMAILAFALHRLGLRIGGGHRRRRRCPRCSSSRTRRSGRRPCPGSSSRSSSAGCSTCARIARAGRSLLVPLLFVAVGEPPRAVGRRACRAGRLRRDAPRRDDADGRRAGAGRSRWCRSPCSGRRSRPRVRRCSSTRCGTSIGRLGHGEHHRVAVARLPRPGPHPAAHLHGRDWPSSGAGGCRGG